MAKYDVAARFQEVAKRARETGPINTGPKKKAPPRTTAQDEHDYFTRPGNPSVREQELRHKDVNLPLSSASPEVKKRLGIK